MWAEGHWRKLRWKLTRPAGPVIRGSQEDLLLRTKWGEGETRTKCNERHTEAVWLASRSHCISKAQGLNAQAKGEVLLSRRNGAAEIFLLVTTQGKQELGGIRVHLVVRTSSADLGLEQSERCIGVSVARFWPPLFFSGGEAQFRDQGNYVVLMAPNRYVQANYLIKN